MKATKMKVKHASGICPKSLGDRNSLPETFLFLRDYTEFFFLLLLQE